MKFNKDNKYFHITTIYARCSALDILKLWEELKHITETNQNP